MRTIRIYIIRNLLILFEKFFFERKLKRFYKKHIPLRNIIDVGSNRGQTIDFFLKFNPDIKIYAFEPNKKLYHLLISKYSKFGNIYIYDLGISSKSGERVFFENILDLTSSFEELNIKSQYLEKKSRILGVKTDEIISSQYAVQTTSLANFINSSVNESIDVLKIDTEGHEYSCLLGLFENKTLQKINFIQLEHHKDDMYKNRIPFKELEELLKSNNYILEERISHGFGNFDEVIFKYQYEA